MTPNWRHAGSATDARFAEFFESHFEGVSRSVMLVVGDRATAQDIAQEAFVKALVRWSRIAGYDQPVGWVRKVAIRMALRHRQREARFEALVDPDEGPSAASQTSGVDLEIVKARGTLSRMQRAALALSYLDDLPVSEIAETLGCAEPTVRVHLHRGRQRLLLALQEEQNDVR